MQRSGDGGKWIGSSQYGPRLGVEWAGTHQLSSVQKPVTHTPAGATTAATKSEAEGAALQSGSLVIPN